MICGLSNSKNIVSRCPPMKGVLMFNVDGAARGNQAPTWFPSATSIPMIDDMAVRGWFLSK